MMVLSCSSTGFLEVQSVQIRKKTMNEIILESHLEQHLNPDGLSGDNMSATVPCNPAQVLNIISAGEEPRALVQGVDGVYDLLLGQVGDGRAVEVPYLEQAQLGTSLVQC